MAKPVWIPCEQNSPEWEAARLGKVTASRFGDVMPGGAGAITYQFELIAEQLTGKASEFSNKHMEWGHENEPAARASYTMRTGNGVDQVGFAIHAEHNDIGCSSDGLIDDDGCVEFKCPSTSKEHLRAIVKGEVPSQYRWQVQGQLFVLDRHWCDFVSYDPRMPVSHRLFVLRVDRDEKMQKQLESRLVEFVESMRMMKQTIAAKMEAQAA